MLRKLMVIDATNLILGRLLTYAAKRAMEGNEVVILNISKAVISGSKGSIIQKAKVRLRTRTLGSQDKAPRHPRKPTTYARRALRGMLPFKKPKGKKAYKMVKIYDQPPPIYADVPKQNIPGAEATKLRSPYIYLGDLSKEIGGISYE
ncbi:MAG: 50S ribosomal protein L13 [Candidatus Bathyarchaeia archaeon]